MLNKNIMELKEKIEGGDKSFEELKKMGEKLIKQAHKEKSNKLYCEVAKLYELIYELKEDTEFAKIIAEACIIIGEKARAVYWLTKFLEKTKYAIENVLIREPLEYKKKELFSQLLKMNLKLAKTKGLGYEVENAIAVNGTHGKIMYEKALKPKGGIIVNSFGSVITFKDSNGRNISKVTMCVVTNKPDYEFKKYELYFNESNLLNEFNAPEDFIMIEEK